jgi:hypothetical protein
MTYKLTAEDITAIELFIERNHSMSSANLSALYGWKSGGSVAAVISAFRKFGVKIPVTERANLRAETSGQRLREARKAERELFLQWKAERAAKARVAE